MGATQPVEVKRYNSKMLKFMGRKRSEGSLLHNRVQPVTCTSYGVPGNVITGVERLESRVGKGFKLTKILLTPRSSAGGLYIWNNLRM